MDDDSEHKIGTKNVIKSGIMFKDYTGCLFMIKSY